LVTAVQQIADWRKKLGMSEYAQRFAENDIDMAVLPDLTDQHLKDLGVSLGHRLKMLRAIRDLTGASVAVTASSAPVETVPTRRDEAERRQLTVMFCDLVGSTALSARLDPEDLRGIIGAYHRCCTEWIERNGGFIAKYMGDGVLAYFGYPRAHEHDAERAVHAGLGLVEAVPKLATSADSPLQVRVGMATGLVVVGDLIGAGAAQEQAVVGETPNLAARLQALAEPGAVVIASSTRRLTGGLFDYRDLGSVPLKGFAENVPAWQVLRVGTVESRFEALRATTTSLVGRDEEIELLLRRWEQAKTGDGQVVLISGEPGIGKSRIAQTVVERLSGLACVISARHTTRTARSIRASRSLNARPGFGARTPPNSALRSSKRYSLRQPMTSVRPSPSWLTCFQSRLVTAIRRSISPPRSGRRRRSKRSWSRLKG
jgi:class 3 adenylate cyclase